MKSVKILRTQSGDWEALYIDGTLVEQGHTLGQGGVPRFWINIANTYKLTKERCEEYELEDVDDDFVLDEGEFPQHLIGLRGVYE